ncbi:diacylglycerol kinase catalytic domain protein [Mycobacterium xenopi 4042]|uniref:Diacylglycerol kinase catalytic domain protein n=1 Tax=Mycobacterium xenopi 4042 TaxID=1299334 RepID=X7YJ76_MYCXE|nr:diacylglycerol kinase catalytic domain protein [Mycobacterium xenopi 4042]
MPTGHIPALAVVPGGSANVAARSLGFRRTRSLPPTNS